MHLAIIGNGITGITAALRARQVDPEARITVISGESKYHYARPALMYVYMGHMRYQDTKPFEDHHWKRQRIDLVRDWVTGIDTERKVLGLHRGEAFGYDKLLIATGSKSNKFGWPGQDLEGVQGLWGLQDLELLYRNSETCRRAVIVGGGLIGIELGEMLHSRGIHVTFLIREESYWDNILPREEAMMIGRLIRASGMELITGTNLKEILPGDDGRCRAVVTEFGDRIDCEIVGLTPGVSPNIDLLAGTSIPTGRGVLVDWSLRTRVPDVFAAGDCAEIETPEGERNLIQQVWYTGRMQGRVAGEVMAGREATYDPGIWFNSAKFLDLEYQTYGRVNMGTPGERSVYWEHADGRHAVRISHVDRQVIGFNFMGIRYRHEVCERWLRDERDLDYVIDHLAEGNFDPELFRRHEAEITARLRRQVEDLAA